MEINKRDLLSAAAKEGITKDQAEKLWDSLASIPVISSKFDLPHVLYYIGALIVISAMGWFLGKGWEKFGGEGIMLISLAYIALYIALGSYLWHKDNLKVPGGLFITLAVCMIPLAIYGFQRYTGWWIVEKPGNYQDFYHWVKGGWFAMEAGTIIGGLVALWFFRFPFLTAPIFFSLWFMSMDITPLIYRSEHFLWDERLWVSLWFGLAIMVIAYLIDQRTREDFAFWGYFFGMLAFWFGLTLLDSNSELMRFIYCCINIVLVLLSVLLQRRVFLIFGALGIFGYIWDLFYRHFSESALFPFILGFIGCAVVFLGIFYSKNQKVIEKTILDALPKPVKNLLPNARRDKADR